MWIGPFTFVIALSSWFISGSMRRTVMDITQHFFLEGRWHDYFFARWDLLKSAWSPLLAWPTFLLVWALWPYYLEGGIAIFCLGLVFAFYKSKGNVYQSVSVVLRVSAVLLVTLLYLLRFLLEHRSQAMASKVFFLLSDSSPTSLWTAFAVSLVFTAYLRTEIFVWCLAFILALGSMISLPVALMCVLGSRLGLSIVLLIKGRAELKLGPLSSCLLLAVLSYFVYPILPYFSDEGGALPLLRSHQVFLFASLVVFSEVLLRSTVYHFVFLRIRNRPKSVEPS